MLGLCVYVCVCVCECKHYTGIAQGMQYYNTNTCLQNTKRILTTIVLEKSCKIPYVEPETLIIALGTDYGT